MPTAACRSKMIGEGAGAEGLADFIEQLGHGADERAALRLAARSSAGRFSRQQPVPGVYLS